jgi:hypothetical protein
MTKKQQKARLKRLTQRERELGHALDRARDIYFSTRDKADKLAVKYDQARERWLTAKRDAELADSWPAARF